jgi:hypothetical protein
MEMKSKSRVLDTDMCLLLLMWEVSSRSFLLLTDFIFPLYCLPSIKLRSNIGLYVDLIIGLCILLRVYQLNIEDEDSFY